MNSLYNIPVKGTFYTFLFLLIACSSTEPYKNPKLPLDKRVDDLISRMTIDEKLSQLIDQAVEIPHLGIPEYNWWNEGLHGVARAGTATVFPQAIGLAATFNDSLLYEVATAISDEFRAKYNYFIKKGERDRYKGLTIWSPNINIFRDPRWGRGQETYGEDPFLTSRMGVAFVNGLQGNHPDYFKTIATPKHYVVHSGPEPLRHVFNAEISQRDFMDTYLTAFEACITEGNAQSVMGAYNRFRGESCTGSPYLLTRILREKWGFDGYVVSDCGAVYDIYGNHKIASSEAEAAAIALRAGCDLDCGREYLQLKEAVEKGYCTETDIDNALRRLFKARLQLGMFDPDEMVPFNAISYEINDCPEHRQLSIEAARESMVLLKNDNHTLPLSKKLKILAVIGPNANRPDVMYGNYNGTPSESVTPLEGIRNKVSPEIQVLYSQGCSYHADYTEKETIPKNFLSSEGKQGLTGEYFNNQNLEGTPIIVRKDSIIDFTWFNETPLHGMVHENYSIRWSGSLHAPKTGNYDLYITGDDGFRLFIDGKLLIDAWENGGWKTEVVSVEFEADSQYSIQIEYYQRDWLARIALEWGIPSDNMEQQALDIAKQSDVILFFGGLSPRLEGEEMEVELSGFNGGDRTSIDLPEMQVQLLQKLHKLGKPVVLVLMNGSALAVNWADENLPAILEAWYPGQEGGTAIADVLFGDYNPAGRLPVTFYRSVEQLPPFEDYNMKGRTYRYFQGEPLYGFGYGLSYSSFGYSNIRVPQTASTTDTIVVEVDVENTGNYPGDEVVQLYVKHKGSSVPVPIYALQGFRRIYLNSSEKKTVSFLLTPRHLSVINDSDERIVLPGDLQLFVGGGQPDIHSVGTGSQVSGTVRLTGETYVIDRLEK